MDLRRIMRDQAAAQLRIGWQVQAKFHEPLVPERVARLHAGRGGRLVEDLQGVGLQAAGQSTEMVLTLGRAVGKRRMGAKAGDDVRALGKSGLMKRLQAGRFSARPSARRARRCTRTAARRSATTTGAAGPKFARYARVEPPDGGGAVPVGFSRQLPPQIQPPVCGGQLPQAAIAVRDHLVAAMTVQQHAHPARRCRMIDLPVESSARAPA